MSEENQTSPTTRRLIIPGQPGPGEEPVAAEVTETVEEPASSGEPELVHPVEEDFEGEGRFTVIDEDAAAREAAEADAGLPQEEAVESAVTEAEPAAEESAATVAEESPVAEEEAVEQEQPVPGETVVVQEDAVAAREVPVARLASEPAAPAQDMAAEEQAQAEAHAQQQAYEQQQQAHAQQQAQAPPPVAPHAYQAPPPQQAYPQVYAPPVSRAVPGWLLVLIGILIGFISALLTFRYTDIGSYFEIIENPAEEEEAEPEGDGGEE